MIASELIQSVSPGPDLDALVHQHFGDGTLPVPRYSTDWDVASTLAARYGLRLECLSDGRFAIMSVASEGDSFEVEVSGDFIKEGEIEVPQQVLATLAAKCLLRLLVYHPDAGQVQFNGWRATTGGRRSAF